MQTKPRRLFLLVIAGTLVVLLAYTSVFVIALWNELPSRLSRYHNLGEITLSVDGEEVSLDGIEITLRAYDWKQTERITNGNFRFRPGEYGENTIEFTIPAAMYGGKRDIPVTIEYINFNNWHVNHYQMTIAIDTQGGTAAMRAQVQAISDRGPHIFKDAIVSLNDPAMILRASY